MTYSRSFVLTSPLLFTLAKYSLTASCCSLFNRPAQTLSVDISRWKWKWKRTNEFLGLSGRGSTATQEFLERRSKIKERI